MPFSALPAAQGLYDPQSERDACGLAMVADLRGRPTHGTVQQAVTALHNLRHRGAAGAEPSSGDGSGLLMQVPDAFYRAVVGVDLPPPRGSTPPASRSCPPTRARAERVAEITAELAAEERLSVLGWREVPTDPTGVGPTARSVMPRFRQVFLAPTTPLTGPLDLERRAFCLRKRLERRTAAEGCAVYLPVAVGPHRGLQGDAHHRPAGHVLPGPARRADRDRDRAGAQPVLDQHVPVLAAGPPVPLHRAQRRDQHDQGQPQLDAGPGGAAGDRRVPRRAVPAAAGVHPRVRPTRRPSTRCSSCCTCPAAACRTRC